MYLDDGRANIPGLRHDAQWTHIARKENTDAWHAIERSGTFLHAGLGIQVGVVDFFTR